MNKKHTVDYNKHPVVKRLKRTILFFNDNEFSKIVTTNVSKKINEILVSENLSMRELSRMLGVSPSTVMRWCNCEVVIDLKHLARLSAMFDFSIDELLNGGYLND